MSQSSLNEHSQTLLADLLTSLIQFRDISAATREWLVIGLLAYVRGEANGLDAALGLSAGGQRHIRTVIAYQTRDRHLAEALDGIALDPAVSTWERCQRLAVEVRRLIPVWNKQYRNAGRPPADWPRWKQALFDAWRVGVGIPATASGLQAKVVEQTPIYSFGSDYMNMLAPYIREQRNENMVQHQIARDVRRPERLR